MAAVRCGRVPFGVDNDVNGAGSISKEGKSEQQPAEGEEDSESQKKGGLRHPCCCRRVDHASGGIRILSRARMSLDAVILPIFVKASWFSSISLRRYA